MPAKRKLPSLAVAVGLLALVGTAEAGPEVSPRLPPKGENSQDELIELPLKRLIVKTTRDDITIGKVILSVYCSSPKALLFNGAHPDPTWAEIHFTASGEITVDRRGNVSPDGVWFYVSLRQIATNEFELPALKMEFRDGEKGLFCISLKAWFNELSNQYDGLFYKNLDDRYALISYCTKAPDDSPARSRFKQNRLATVDEFKAAFSKPLVIKMNERPLREEWRPRPGE